MKIVNLKIYLIKLRKIISLKGSELYDSLLLKTGIPLSFPAPSNGKTTILFAGDFLPPRISRIAKWLKRTGDYNICLLCHTGGYTAAYAEAEWDSKAFFRNAAHLKRFMKSLNGIDILHAFHPKSYYPDLMRKEFKGLFISDFQDVLSIYYPKEQQPRWLRNELPHERNCLEYSTGIVAHSMEPLIARKKLNYKKPENLLFFPLYCDDDAFTSKEKETDLNDLHLVYAGNIAGSHRDKKQYGIIQLHWLVEALEKQKIHLHIYPSPSTLELDYNEYYKLAEKNKFLHMHQPVSQSELSAELSMYDFGLLPFFQKDNGNTIEKFRYATTLKLFNYAEAGIPVLVTHDLFYQSWITQRYGLGIAVDRQDFYDLKSKIQSNPKPLQSFKKMVLEGRKALSLKTNITRLEKFYKELIATDRELRG